MAESSELELSRAERASLALARLLNENPTGKRLQSLYHLGFGRHWAQLAVGRRVYADNIDWLISAPSDRGVMLAINHRSFFDLFAVMVALYRVGARWPKKIFFPVRSAFFYETPAGVALNVLIGGGTLYPPFFRDPGKAGLNKDAVERLAQRLGEPGTLVGLHPEGTRNRGDDPYTLLPAQPGVGQIALLGRPMVVPVFVNGLSNSAGGDIVDSWTPGARRERPIVIVFGAPVEYEDLKAQKPRAALYKRMADRMNQAITALGPRERELRAAAARGELVDGDPGWVTDRP